MTADQSDADPWVRLAYEAAISNSAEYADEAAHTSEARGAVGNSSSLTSRARLRGPNNLPPSSAPPVSPHAAAPPAQSPIERLFMSAREEMVRLDYILRAQQCTAVMRTLDGSLVRAKMTTVRAGDSSKPGRGGLDRQPTASVVCTPVFDAEGRKIASLDIIPSDAAHAERSQPLLRALLESAGRAITERWFRMVHRRQWVVAAMPRGASSNPILVAADRDQTIVGADRHAQRFLEEKGQRMGRRLTLSALFRPDPTLLRPRSHCDVPTTLFALGDGEPWIALITPPDRGTVMSYQDPRLLLHARPRLDCLPHLSSLPLAERTTRGLSQGALQRIEEYINAHLDSALDIDELAAMVRMSSSHFSRSFHKSVGVTPHRYVIHNRIMRARELLVSTTLPLSEIALTTGFSDQSHLSRRFHEVVGVPPGEFRGHDGLMPQRFCGSQPI